MELGYFDFKNKVNYDDYGNIIGYERRKWLLYIGDITVDFYIIRLNYKDGSYRDIRAYCEAETSSKLVDEREKELFFVKRLFGKDGLIIKEQRNDYIYLGGINEEDREHRFSRFRRLDDGKTMQQTIDERVMQKVLPKLSFENMGEDWDLLNMEYYFHTGNEDMSDVFTNGMRNRYGSGGRDGFCSLSSTFYPIVTGGFCESNGLCDAVKLYGEATRGKGSKVFIIRMPLNYRGKVAADGNPYPPMPTHKLMDYESGDSIIIPEIIYGMYDLDNKILYKNPNYNPKYNPNGLSYDQEAADVIKVISGAWYNFMKSRIRIPYDVLKRTDERNRTFEQACKCYGIDYGGDGSIRGFFSSFRRK